MSDRRHTPRPTLPDEILSVEVELPNASTPTPRTIRTSRSWAKGFKMLERALAKSKIPPDSCVPLELPRGAESWIVKRSGIPFRCTWVWAISPLFGVPRFIGRVDVGWKS